MVTAESISLTLTKGGISVHIDPLRVAASGYYWDGQPWVQPKPGFTLTVLGWTPGPSGTGTGFANGAMKNPRGNRTTQGLDGRAAYDGTLTFSPGQQIAAGDSLVIARSGAGDGANQTVARPTYFPLPSRSRIDEMFALSVVSAPPALDAFRPSAIGNPAARVAKLQGAIQWDKLPAFFSHTHPNAPSLGTMETVFGGFFGDVMSGWTSDQWAPNFQHPGYGQYLASAVSEAMLLATSMATRAQKQALVLRLIQWGIDYWGAFLDGRANDSNGGHMQGRKPLVIFAGHMLGDAAMADPRATLGAARFQEDVAYYTDATPMWSGPHWKWCYNAGNAASRAYQDDDPATWASGNGNVPGFFERYHGISTIAANVGAGMALSLLGRTEEWGRAAWANLLMHMLPWPASWASAQQAAIPYYPSSIRKAWSHRGGAARQFADTQWDTGLVGMLLHRRQTYATGAADQPIPVALELPTYDAAFEVEIYNAPTSGVTAVEVWLGYMLPSMVFEDGFEKWTSAKAHVEIVGNDPNAYGWHAIDVTIPTVGDDVKREASWCLQVVYRTSGGTVASVPLVFILPV